jgi:phosphatidylinositol glycan class N
VLIFMGFFGTGNVASLNSFDPMWVRCFLTVFSPFKMTGLILLRIMVPFIFTSCVFRAINIFRKGSTLSMFCIVLVFSDLMLLELMYCITNIGSWLEIGMSLSHFIIMEMFVLMLLMLYGLAYFLTTMLYTIPLNHFLYHI